MSSSLDPLAADQSSAVATVSTSLPGTFLGLALYLKSDRLYDLTENIPDVIGLHALRPSAAICKVITVPDSCCVRVVTPDDHVNMGFHEILMHDLAQEEWPLVTLSDIGCLLLDWPKSLFTFMGRFQFELDQMRTDCRERFGTTQSGNFPTRGKHIKMNLGKHVALYHLDLAKLWRSPVSWCTIWKGTSQDCVDHMRKAHDTPIFVKAANLAYWFPPWTVTRMSRPAISGIAIDTLFVQPHWSTIVPPLSGFLSSGNARSCVYVIHGLGAASVGQF